MDVATREALSALLRDETPFRDDTIASGNSTLGDFAANALFALATGGAKRNRWEMEVAYNSACYLTTRWMRQQALAIASGGRPAPLPNPANVTAAKTSALIRRLCALPPTRVAAYLTQLKLDEQIAVVARLGELDKWPPPLAAAHFTVGNISGEKANELGAAGWTEKQLDKELVGTITAAVREAASSGKNFVVTLSIAGALSGCAIQVEESPGAMTPEEFWDAGIPGLADKPPPLAICRISIEESFFGNPQSSPRFGFPVWTDESLTKAWRDEHAHSPPAANEPDYYYSEQGRKMIPSNPAAFDEKLRECLKVQRFFRGPLRLTILATGIDKGS
jgi:hypothetical protein